MKSRWRVAGAAWLLLAAGCGSGPVEVDVPQPDAQATRACQRLYERLPQRLDGQPRRQTEPSSQLVAAWGSPAIVVRCGVGKPAKLRPTSQLAVVNDVEWLPEPKRTPMHFTTVHRVARVELLLPREHGVPADAMVHLAAPIKKAVPPQG